MTIRELLANLKEVPEDGLDYPIIISRCETMPPVNDNMLSCPAGFAAYMPHNKSYMLMDMDSYWSLDPTGGIVNANRKTNMN